MSRERTVNAGVTTLNGAINDSTTTIVTSDSTQLSASPQFRIIIDSEIMLVTGVSGNTLTVTRGAESSTAAAHNDGATVAQIMTREGLQRYMRDWNNPYFDDSNAIPQQLLDSSDATLTASSFTEINFAGSGTPSKADSSQGSIVLDKAAQSAANNYALMVKSAPSPTWIWTVGIIPNLPAEESADLPTIGACVRDNGTGEFYDFQIDKNGAVRVDKYSGPTASATAFLTGDAYCHPHGPYWLQVEDDNANLYFRISADGVNFVELGSEARTTHLSSVDQIGICINNFGNDYPIQGTLVAWDES